jgi:quercetin dioxygenase-like cupin family protein
MKHAILAAASLTLFSASALASDVNDQGKLLLEQNFGTLTIDKIESSDLHYPKGYKLPVHTHAGPVFGYVSKGSIIYQVEGQEPQLRREGDAFYEPAGTNILHFDNTSDSEEAVFTAVYLQKNGQPLIVFPVPPKEKADRRIFPSAEIGQTTVHKIEIRKQTIAPGPGLDPHQHKAPVLGYVADGELKLGIAAGETAIIKKGQSFYEPEGKTITAFASANGGPVKVISFILFE